MSWRDRPYASDDSPQPELRIQLRRPSTVVTWLIVANVAVFFVDAVVRRLGGNPSLAFGLSLLGIKKLHFWQLLTYMFMHAGVWHLVCNMIGLYIFGSEFERAFGRDRFLHFYAICGMVGGLAYLALAAINPWYLNISLVGASGAVYGLLIAAIIFFPHIRVILIIFPMPIRVFGLIVAGILLLQLISGNVSNPGGEVCHMAGAATGIAMFYAWGIMPRIRFGSGGRTAGLPFGGGRPRRSQGAWARKRKALAEEQADLDRILAKVHDQGLQSLTRKEKKTLARATKRQQEQERQMGRIDRL